MKKRVVLVSGMSGAGKSSASSVLEDMGYHCIDQFPVQMLGSFIGLVETSSDPRYQYIALSTSAIDFFEFIKAFNSANVDLRILFLSASNEVLLSRYKSTRRTHPLLISNVTNTLEEAIQIERQMFSQYKEYATLVVDTTHMGYNELKKKIENNFNLKSTPTFAISLISFGYKNGVPRDVDLMFDVRFLPNPYWDLALRPYSGDDENVYNFVMSSEETKAFLLHLESFLMYLLDKYVQEGKNHLTIGIGCTGGQHRSVSITNYLYQLYKDKYTCFKDHRDKVDYMHE